MQISVFGRTDKRACIYTLMNILQRMGDVAVITSNRSFRRLTEDDDYFGMFQNISIFVTDATADEMWETVGAVPEDFEHVILDNLYNEDTNLCLYIEGAGKEALDEDLFDALEDMEVIAMGDGAGKVPYTKELMRNLEFIEYYRKFVVPSPMMLQKLAKALSTHLGMPAKDIEKVAKKK